MPRKSKKRQSPFPSQPVPEVLEGASLDGEGSLTQQVYRLVRGLIVRLALLPNQFLSEKDVAASLDISKTPVREAFIRLAEDGIVRIVPKSGTYVAPIDLERASEGVFIWASLESSCAWQAAQQFSMDDIGGLRDLLSEEEKCIEAGDVEGFVRTNARFHATIFAMADLADARKMIDSARFEVDRVLRLRQGFYLDNMERSHAEHGELVNAIVRHDAEGARETMLRHLTQLRSIFDSLTDDPELSELFTFLNRKRPGTRRSRADR